MPRHSNVRRARAALMGGLAVVLAASLSTAPARAADAPALAWTLRDTGGTNHFRGLAAVNARVAWLGGYDGQILRTVDGGATWADVSPRIPGVATLQFRDIAASDATHAVAMAAGEGTASRLLVTADAGVTWRTAYRNTNPAAFFDCMSFSDARNGLVVSDPVDGRFRVLATTDGGQSWQVRPRSGMPPARAGEAAFAAGGQCLTTSGDDAWFATGGAARSRIYHSTDAGVTWTAQFAPLRSTASGGAFALAFSTPSRGVVVGGDFNQPTYRGQIAATQLVGGTWRPSGTMPHGYRSGVTFVPRTAGTVLAVGLTGSDVSTDGGKTWTAFDDGSFDTVTCAGDGSCWAAGELGRVAVLQRS